MFASEAQDKNSSVCQISRRVDGMVPPASETKTLLSVDWADVPRGPARRA